MPHSQYKAQNRLEKLKESSCIQKNVLGPLSKEGIRLREEYLTFTKSKVSTFETKSSLKVGNLSNEGED